MSSMITIAFFVLVFATFTALVVVNRSKEDSVAVKDSNFVLLVASLVFVTYSDWKCATIIVSYSILIHFCAVNGKTKLGVIVSILVLGFFKYFNFFVSSFTRVLGMDSVGLSIILPLGISLFVFSAIGYLVDVSREKTKVQNYLNTLLYLAYFPKFVSGPIIKTTDFFDQLSNRREVGYKSFEEGIEIFVLGLFKKVVLADRLSVFVNQVYATPKAFGSLTLAFAVISYSFQIYLDFSGYSDMAIGISRLFGIILPRNFNLPYLSHNSPSFGSDGILPYLPG